MDEKNTLRKYYDRLYNVLQSKNELKKNQYFSILIRYLKMSSKPAHEFLRKGHLKNNLINVISFDKLKNNGLIRESTIDAGYSYITAKGVWEIEKDSSLKENRLIEFIDEEKFHHPLRLSSKNIDDKDRVKLFVILATRAFTEDLAVSLKTEELKNKWKKATDDCCDFMLENNIIKSEKKRIYGSAKSEAPIVNLWRHSEYIPNKTKLIFKTSRKGVSYYIDIANNEEIDEEKVLVIIKAIFGDKLNSSIIKKVSDFWNDMAFESNKLFTNKQFFSHPKYDLTLEDVLYKISSN